MNATSNLPILLPVTFLVNLETNSETPFLLTEGGRLIGGFNHRGVF
jgi:hypothetical protein